MSDEGVFIFKITPGGVASRKPDDLIVGQRIIEVNGQSLLGATHSEAVNAMRETGNLIVCDGWNNSVKAIQNGRAEETTSSMMDEQPPRPDSAQEIHDAVKAADDILRPKSPGAESTKSTDSLREQRLTTIKMASQGPVQTSTPKHAG